MDGQQDLTRRNALAAAGGLGLSFLAGQVVAADEGQQKEKQEKTEMTRPPEAVVAGSVMNRDGERSNTLEGVRSIAQIQYHQFNFQSSNGSDWLHQTKMLTMPASWNSVTATPTGWRLSFLPDDHHVGLLGLYAWLTGNPSRVDLHCMALLRDDNGDDHWSGNVIVQVMIFA